MSKDSPGERDKPPDIIISEKLTPNANTLLKSLHKLSPLHIQEIVNLEKELEMLGQYFTNEEIILNEIKKIKSKLDEAKKKKIVYSNSDIGPFIVMVEHSKENNTKNIHPMDLGKMLFNLKIDGILEIKRKGASRVGITFKMANQANNFMLNNEISKRGYTTFIPQSLLTCKGIVRDIGYSIQEQDIVAEAYSHKTILDARRLNRKSQTSPNSYELIPTKSILITFEGRQLPEKISIYANIVDVIPYIPPVRQCINCLRFGHSKQQCRSKTKCPKCQENHSLDMCQSNTVKCFYCDLEHSATDRSCNEFKRQKLINEKMAFSSLSYYDAEKLFPRLKKTTSSFQSVSQAFPALPQYPHFSTPNNPPSQIRPSTPAQQTSHTFNHKSPRQFNKKRKSDSIERPTTPNLTQEIIPLTFPSPCRTQNSPLSIYDFIKASNASNITQTSNTSSSDNEMESEPITTIAQIHSSDSQSKKSDMSQVYPNYSTYPPPIDPHTQLFFSQVLTKKKNSTNKS